jgi:arylsulfatase A-like enzyme
VVKDENTSVWEVLSGAGVHTAGVASHFYFTEERGIRQGFAEFDNEGATNIKDSNPDIASPRIVPRAIAKLGELGKAGGRFALFVHLFEPHSTYVTHDEYPIEGKGLEGLEEKYDYEVKFVDQWVGKLVDGLAAAGLADGTAIVLVSDHGEAFGEHRVGGERMFFHGQTLYDELLHVPIVIIVPGVAPRAVDTPVMLVDVGPTLADLMGAAPAPDWAGKSLVPALAGETLPARPIVAELLPAPAWNHDAKAMIDVDGKTKLVYRVSDNVFELYDLSKDPGEQQNLAATQPEATARMKTAITRWMESQL